jgi:hypothetical protein
MPGCQWRIDWSQAASLWQVMRSFLEGVLKDIGCDGKHSKIPPSPPF